MPPDFWPSVARAFAIALVAVWAGTGVARVLRSLRSPRLRTVAVLTVALPFVVPPLVLAYGYLKPFLFLAKYPVAEDLCYSGLVLLRVMPVAAFGRYLLPPLQSSEARYCQALLDRSVGARVVFGVRHVEPAAVVVAVLVFMIAFHEFELASLWQRPAWTVAAFDAQAQGFALAASWERAVVPLLLQLVLMGVAYAWLRRCDAHEAAPTRVGRHGRIAFWVYGVLALAVTVGYPTTVLLADAWSGLARLPEAFSFYREVGASVQVAFVSATFAYLLSHVLLERTRLMWGALIPGLLGPLLLALTILAAIQLPVFRNLRDTPIPLVVALTVLMLPITVLLVVLVKRQQQSEAGWLVQLVGSRSLSWAHSGCAFLWVWSFVFYMAYFEITASAILAPPSMTTVLVRLYNLMHYGQDTMLSAYVLVAVAVPLLVLGLAAALGWALSFRK